MSSLLVSDGKMIDISDIKASIQSKALIQDEFFKDALFLKDSRGRLLSYTGGYTVVIPSIVNGEKWAFRCWHVPVKDSKKRYSLITGAIHDAKLPYFCSFEYTEKGLLVKGESLPITKMKWVDGKNLKNYICAHYKEKGKIKDLAQSFMKMITCLHGKKIAHGDLQHGNILVSETGHLYLVDYDSMYVPAMGNVFPDIITGLIDYQHPARKKNRFSSEKLDYFSELVIYTSLLGISEKPDFVTSYNVEDSERLLFSASDFHSFESSKVYEDLTALKNPKISQCLTIFKKYLAAKDISELKPIDLLLLDDVAKEAEQKEQSAWREACRRDTIGQYEAYLKEFPDGPHADEARNCITRLRDDNRWAASCRKNTLEAYRLYQTDWPKGRHISECRQIIDELIWYAALNENTIESYENYIRNSTTGKYVGKARKKIRRLKWIKRAIKWFLAFAFFILAACTVNEYKEFFVQLKDTIISHLNIVPQPTGGGEKSEVNTTQGGVITIPENNGSNQDRIKDICEDLDRRLKVLEEAKPYLDFTKGEDFNPHAKEKVEELIRQLNRLDHAKAAKFQLRYDNLYKK